MLKFLQQDVSVSTAQGAVLVAGNDTENDSSTLIVFKIAQHSYRMVDLSMLSSIVSQKVVLCRRFVNRIILAVTTKHNHIGPFHPLLATIFLPSSTNHSVAYLRLEIDRYTPPSTRLQPIAVSCLLLGPVYFLFPL